MVRFALSSLALISLAPALAANCQPVLDAFRALASRDTYAQIITMSDGSVVETRVLPGAMYVKDGDQWDSLPGGPEMRKQMLDQLIPDASALKNCEMQGSEALGGVATTVYSYVLPELEAVMAGAGTQRVLIRDGDSLPQVLRSADTDVVFTYEGVVAP